MGNFFANPANGMARVFITIGEVPSGSPQIPGVGPIPPLELTITFVSSAEPNRGDTVQVRWECTPSVSLAFQTVRLHTLAFDGRFATQTFGCLPEALLHVGEDPRPCTPLDLAQRSFRLTLHGPVTFQLIAGDGADRILQKFIKFGLRNAELTLRIAAGHGNYPRLAGKTTVEETSIRFENAFGIHEAPGGRNR